LSLIGRFSVPRHLQGCWQCRLRLDEIEREVLEVTRELREDAFSGPQRYVDAQLQFLDRADAVAKEVFAAAEKSLPNASVRRLSWIAASLLLVAGSWWIATHFRGTRTVSPREVIVRVGDLERKSTPGLVHQRFRLVTRQILPVSVNHESRLELWHEPTRGRFASRLEDSTGTLRHAIWQPEPSRRYIYSSLRADRVIDGSTTEGKESWSTVLFRDDVKLNDLEAGLLLWLEQRSWRLISLSSTLALFASQEDATLHLERSLGASGAQFLRLSARKTVGRITVEFLMEVDERSYQPRLQKIRYESPVRVLELTFVPEIVGDVAAVSFEPPQSLMRPARNRLPLNRPVPPQLPQALAPLRPDLTHLEIEILYALHRVRACVGEPVELVRQPDHNLLVRGVASTLERKEQLAAVLMPFTENSPVRVEIQTTEEALQEISPQSITNVPALRQPYETPVHGQLKRYFAQISSDPSRMAEQFADEVLSRGQGLAAEAGAVHRLAEKFANGKTEKLDFSSRSLLENMVRDHLAELQRRVETTQELLTPALSAICPVPALRQPDRRHNNFEGTWQQSLLVVFDDVVSLTNRLQELFTGNTNHRSPELIIPEIFAAMYSIRTDVTDATERLDVVSSQKATSAK
jgi:hypothetical protein